MAKALVHATIQFGLVSAHVSVVSAVKATNDIEFNRLHVCGTPVETKTESVAQTVGQTVKKTWCSQCGEEATETIRGYQYAKGQFVTVTDEEFDATKPPQSKAIVVNKFVPETQVTPLLVEQTYYLQPNPVERSTYALLYQTVAKLKVAGIGTEALFQQKEHPCAIYADRTHGVLGMHVLRLQEDLAAPDWDAPIPEGQAKTAEAKKMAETIVVGLKGDLQPEDLVSAQRQRVQALIAAKLAGEPVPVVTVADAGTLPDLMEAMRQTIEATKAKA